MPVTIYPTTLKYKNQNGQFQSATAIKGDSGAAIVVQVEGTSPAIVCEDNHRYICGEVLSLNITPPTNGVCEIIFESGSTATLLTVPNTIKWPEWFNPSILEPNATYQFKISNGLANVAIWPDEGLTGDTRVRIQKMLGIYEAPWELIREDTFTNATSADHVINTDANGQSFELEEAIILFETPVQDTESSIGSSGGLKFGYITPASGSTSYATKIEIGSWTQASNASAHGGAGVFKQDNGLVQIYRVANTIPSNTGGIGIRYGTGFPNLGASDRVGFAIVSETWYVNSITIMTVTGTGHYKLFGKRKWD